MAMIEPPPDAYESEWRYRFTAANPGGDHVVFSGYCKTWGADGTDDMHHEPYDVHLMVGPFWESVTSVVPTVNIAAFWNGNADEDDQQGWTINGLTWEAVGGQGANQAEKRIRLKFTVGAMGEKSHVDSVSYFVFARGRGLGQQGLFEPPPAWPNP